MRKILPYLFGLVLVVSLGSYLQWKYCCNQTAYKGMYIEDFNGDVLIDIDDDFTFKYKSSNHRTPISNNLVIAVQKIKEYLSSNKDRALVITGLYSESELEEIGLNRALDISNYLNKQGIKPVQLIEKKELDSSLKWDNDSSFKSSLKYTIGDAIATDFGFIDIEDKRTGFNFTSTESFTFKKDNFNIEKPVAQILQDGFVKVHTFLNQQEDKVLVINGFYRAEERNQSIFPNLGIARAISIKEYLTRLGISSNKIEVRGEETKYLSKYAEAYNNPVSFTLATRDDNLKVKLQSKYTEFIKEIKLNPIMLYFEVGDDSISISDSQREKIVMSTEYLDFIDNANVLVVGHTSNKGMWKDNLKLGKDRAEFLKNYLIKNGFSQDKIITRSSGESKPIASNLTEEGRAKNRRVELTLK